MFLYLKFIPKTTFVVVRNPNVSLSSTLTRNEKVEYYIKIKTHKPIALRFWVESSVNALCGWAHVSLVLYLPSDTPPYRSNKWYQRQ